MRVDSQRTMTSTQIERSPGLNNRACNRRGKQNIPKGLALFPSFSSTSLFHPINAL